MTTGNYITCAYLATALQQPITRVWAALDALGAARAFTLNATEYYDDYWHSRVANHLQEEDQPHGKK